jgi:DNA topoisomerase I
LKLGKFGAFIGCSRYPECRYTRPLGIENGANGEGEGSDIVYPRELGLDPASGLKVTMRKGPYGVYVQLGEAEEDGEKPKRASLPRGVSPADIDLDKALKLLALPRDIGAHPESGEMIIAGNGRFGPYIKLGKTYRSLTAGDDVLTIGLNRAVSLLAEPRAPRRGGKPEPLRTLGDHPDGGAVQLFKGRYGPYVSHNGVNATLPSDITLEEVKLEDALPLLAAKSGKGKRKAKPKAKAKSKTNNDTKTTTDTNASANTKGKPAGAKTNGRQKKSAGPAPETSD